MIDTVHVTENGGRDLEISLRQILRKIQLLRLDVALRNVQQHHDDQGSNESNRGLSAKGDNEQNQSDDALSSLSLSSKVESAHKIETTPITKMDSHDSNGSSEEEEEDEFSHSIYSENTRTPMEPRKYQSAILRADVRKRQIAERVMVEPPDMNNVMKAKSVGHSLTAQEEEQHHERMQHIVESKEEEQDRIMKAISKQEETDNENLVSALLFATKYHHQQYVTPTNLSKVMEDENGKETKTKIKLKRRRFTLSAGNPTESDRAGIEVARWLSTRYSTFGRYELPQSVAKGKGRRFRTEERDGRNEGDAENAVKSRGTMTKKAVTMHSMTKQDSVQMEKERLEKQREMMEKRKRKMSATKSDVLRMMKLVASDQILAKLKGIGEDWNWCIFDLYEVCGDSILLITAHYVFEQVCLFVSLWSDQYLSIYPIGLWPGY